MNAAQKKLAIAYLRNVALRDLAEDYERDGDRFPEDLVLLRAMRAAVRALRKVKVGK